MFTQIQKRLRASPTVIIVEFAIPEACNKDGFPNFCAERENIFTSWAIALGGVATGSMKA